MLKEDLARGSDFIISWLLPHFPLVSWLLSKLWTPHPSPRPHASSHLCFLAFDVFPTVAEVTQRIVHKWANLRRFLFQLWKLFTQIIRHELWFYQELIMNTNGQLMILFWGSSGWLGLHNAMIHHICCRIRFAFKIPLKDDIYCSTLVPDCIGLRRCWLCPSSPFSPVHVLPVELISPRRLHFYAPVYCWDQFQKSLVLLANFWERDD